jgi:hypothetical protein
LAWGANTVEHPPRGPDDLADAVCGATRSVLAKPPGGSAVCIQFSRAVDASARPASRGREVGEVRESSDTLLVDL